MTRSKKQIVALSVLEVKLRALAIELREEAGLKDCFLMEMEVNF